MSSNIPYVKYQALNYLAQYVTGASINHMATPILPTLGTMYLFEGGMWAFNNRKDLKGAFGKIKTNSAENIQIRKSSKNIFEASKKILNKNDLANFVKSLPKDAAYNTLRQEAQAALQNGNIEKLKALEAKKAKIDYISYKNRPMPTGKVKKAVRVVKDKTGITAAKSATKKAVATSSKLRFLKKIAKGGAGMAVISGLCEVPNVINTYKELGKEAGRRQLRKSAVNVAAEAVGYLAGAKAGAAIGAAVGSIVPGIGTVIGGVIGVACGVLGSVLLGKAARSIQGKDELELAEEQKVEDLAIAATKDSELREALILESANKLNQEMETNGELSENGQLAANTIDKIIEEMNTTNTTSDVQVVQQQTQQTTTNTETQTANNSNNDNQEILNILSTIGNFEITQNFAPQTNFNPTMFNPFLLNNPYNMYNTNNFTI